MAIVVVVAVEALVDVEMTFAEVEDHNRDADHREVPFEQDSPFVVEVLVDSLETFGDAENLVDSLQLAPVGLVVALVVVDSYF